MFLRVSKQRLKSGAVIEHYQLAESSWDRRKKQSKTTVLYNFGRVDNPDVREGLRKLAHSILRRCAPEDIVADSPDWRLVDSWQYGDLFVLETLWRRLGIDHIIAKQQGTTKTQSAIERALFAMVANRAIAPSSKLECYEQWLKEDVRIDGTADLQLHQLYRAMDFLEKHKSAIEEAIYFSMSDLLSLDVDLIFYDTTSLHFEIEDEDHGIGPEDEVRGSELSGAKKYKAPRKRGYSKNGRSDVPQIVVGLAVTRDGFPVRHWIFQGNTVDVTTVKQVKADLRGWKLGRCVFVGDAGMVSQDNMRTLSLGGGKYILCMPWTRGGEVADVVAARPGRYKPVADNLQVKEVIVGDGERRRRYVVCFNPDEQRRQRKHRAQRLAELEAEIETLKELDSRNYTKRVFALAASRRYGRYVRRTKTGKLRIDRDAIRRAERHDGKFIVHSNDDTLSAEDLALGYKQLMRVEQAWRTLKSGLKLRPVYHYAPHRIHAHVFLTVLAMLLERVAEHACADTWRNIRADLRQIKLAHLLGPNGAVWQVTEPRDGARKRLKLLRIDNLPTVLDHA